MKEGFFGDLFRFCFLWSLKIMGLPCILMLVIRWHQEPKAGTYDRLNYIVQRLLNHLYFQLVILWQ